VHSHERYDFHHITTFHGPRFAQIREKSVWNKLSIRVLTHLCLERRELLAPSVSKVAPNSELIFRSLMRHSHSGDNLGPGAVGDQPPCCEIFF
jgi:UDP-glucose:(heptosyl)LPS alpha-1,3-glucosyltransferase